MSWRNTDSQYGGVAKTFHWLIAALIITVLTLGLIMVDADNGPGKFALFRWHKALGITVLALACLRIVWRLASVHPVKLPSHATWEKVLAGIAHFLLYYCMVAMPLSGWLMSSAKGVTVNVFGLTLPDLLAPDKHLGHLLTIFHVYTAYGLIGLICLHAAGALKHHVIDRDETLRRMLPRGSLIAGFGIAVLTLVLIGRMLFAAHIFTPSVASVVPAPATQATQQPASPVAGTAANWIIDHAQSHLTFECTQNGAPFTGTFASFDGAIAFDPSSLATSHAEITVTMKDVSTQSDERDSSLGQTDWFNVESFPKSTFVTTSFEEKGENQYLAHGKLTLRGVTLPVDLPFTLVISQDPQGNKVAKMDGTATLQRLDFGIGTGEWADPKAVGTLVTVRVSLVARAKS